MFAAVLSCAAAPASADTGNLAAYLKARADDADGRVTEAAAGYARVLAATPGDTDVALRAYREALATGDDELARRAAAVLVAAGKAPADVPLLAVSDPKP